MSDFVELRKLIGAIWRMWWLVGLVMLCAGVLGYLYSISQTPIYEATSTLLVGQSIQSRDLNRSQIQTSQEVGLTYADIARRYPVLNGTVEALGLEQNWQALRGSVEVALVRNTQLIEISVRSANPEEAEAIANEVARQLIILSPTEALNQDGAETREFVQQRLASLQQKIEAGEARLAELQSIDLSTAPSEEIVQSQAQITELEGLITDWESNYSSLLSSLTPANDAANYLEVIEPALARNAPVSPLTMLNTLVALILGAITGISLALLRDYLDTSVRNNNDVVSLLNVPCLGEIGRLPGKSDQERLLFHQDLYSRPAEDYRLIRSKLQLIDATQQESHSILFTSPGRQEGSSLTVANLGIAMSQAGLRTVIIDADLRQPKQHTLFELENDRGLINLLCYPELKVDGLLKKCKYASNLHLLNAGVLWDERTTGGGSLSLTPTELLGIETMRKILGQIREKADMILIDSPPIVPFADPAVLSAAADGVVLVLSLNRTKQPAAEQAMLNLKQANAKIYGFVSNRRSGLSAGKERQPSMPQHSQLPSFDRELEPALLSLQGKAQTAKPDEV